MPWTGVRRRSPPVDLGLVISRRGRTAYNDGLTAVLVVDHDIEFAELIRDGLRDRKYAAEAVHSAKEALAFLERNAVDIVVAHIHLREVSGLELVARLRDRQSEVLGIVVTSQGSMETAVAAIRAGAYDFITKPVTLAVLEVALERAVAYQTLRREVGRLRLTVAAAQPIDAIIGDSPAIHEVTTLVRRVAATPATVLITGESGTGKELVARAIHDHSDRRSEPFVAINCGALPPALLESELFGHVRGAFTDARQNRPGLFVQAGDGTLFLDEIGEMPIEMQIKLLRVLQERMLRPVGGDMEVPFGARLIAATNRDLETAIEEKRFREDLYYRINVVQIPIPPLRARVGDLPVLARHFIEKIAARSGRPPATLDADAMRKLIAYDWPGNVRELQNCMERVMAIGSAHVITVQDLPPKIRDHDEKKPVIATSTGRPDELITLDEIERRYIRQVLLATNNNKTDTARILGIDRRSLYRRLHGGGPGPTPAPVGADTPSED
ncbi:MAG TPA: sigma-54 dependent transcriptional regulator [Kofleriaceae bacterium]|nr:sigma-54 dependent transcriptional regulator [Kofleriaceae bacterium]